MKVVEVRINLPKSDIWPKVQIYAITHVTQKHYYAARVEGKYAGHRFLRNTLNEPLYAGTLHYYYRFEIDCNDDEAILHSELMKTALTELQQKISDKLGFYNQTLISICGGCSK